MIGQKIKKWCQEERERRKKLSHRLFASSPEGQLRNLETLLDSVVVSNTPLPATGNVVGLEPEPVTIMATPT